MTTKHATRDIMTRLQHHFLEKFAKPSLSTSTAYQLP